MEVRELLRVHDRLITWMDRCVVDSPSSDHTAAHFLAITFREHAALLRESARQVLFDLTSNKVSLGGIERKYQRLLAVFSVEISAFERKRYQNVSHEANKAANLNTYIGVLGRTVRERWHADGLHLEVVEDNESGREIVTIPDASFVLTLDADSMLRPDYALRLSSVLAMEGNERVAVVQTPYTAIPNTPGLLERIAGATTDMQYIVHQGFTWCDATFWVGANALLRKRALDEIRTEVVERGYPVSKYIQDRTVIEDTESTVDLAFRGWTLRNYPDRLAFSATPPDFGSLLIQRTRWANGGLLIVPKLVQHALTRPFRAITLPSFLMRLHYLTSIATSSIGMLVLLFLPVDAGLFSMWLPVLAAAYFSMYWRDLLLNGYLPGDILRVSAFNVMLVPINLAGVLKSIRQGLTGTRTPFARTPKVEGRTAAPAWAILSLWLLLGWSLFAGVMHVVEARWLHAAFSLVIASSIAYAMMAFVGPKAGWEDATRSIRGNIGGLSPRREQSPPLQGIRSRWWSESYGNALAFLVPKSTESRGVVCCPEAPIVPVTMWQIGMKYTYEPLTIYERSISIGANVQTLSGRLRVQTVEPSALFPSQVPSQCPVIPPPSAVLRAHRTRIPVPGGCRRLVQPGGAVLAAVDHPGGGVLRRGAGGGLGPSGGPEIFNTDQGSQFTSAAFTGGAHRGRDRASRWMGAGAGWTTSSSSGCGDRSSTRSVYPQRPIETGSEARGGIGRWIDLSTTLHRNTHLAMSLAGRGFVDRDSIPWGIWGSFWLAP